MTEEENYTHIDISDMVEDTEHFTDTDAGNNDLMMFETETHSELHTELNLDPEVIVISTEAQLNLEKAQPKKSEVIKPSFAPKLAMGRIKSIMKMDPDVNIVQQDAVYLVTKATELFLETLAKETYSYLPKNKKTINKRELDLVINRVDCLCFLEGAIDF